MSTPYHRYFLIFVFCSSVYLLFVYTGGKTSDLFVVEDLGATGLARENRLKHRAYTRTIVGIGDLHGDLPNALKVLKMTNVIDDDNNWSGKVDYLVQTGDIIDRGDDTIPLYKLMEKLREQAPLKGGVFLSTLGNHEVMNAIGDWRYVYASEIKTFGGVESRQAALSSTGWLGKAWAQNYTVTNRLPLHPKLGSPNIDYDPAKKDPISHAALSFVHGGLSPDFPYLTPYPSSINSIGHSLLHKLQTRPQPPPHPPNPYPGLPASATNAEEHLYDGEGPLWYRGWANEREKEACKKIDDVLDRTGTRRLIMGHTPTFTNIVSRCNGKVIIIDTVPNEANAIENVGISHAYGGVLSGLSITYSLSPATPEPRANSQQRWIETEKVAAVYEQTIKVLAEETRELVGNYGAY
ncbi:hypothetical protein FRC17_000947 [Serendipita sp. 399]|nr:hypothetical protein FRC17_000947 [Serendipita sp. 399]